MFDYMWSQNKGYEKNHITAAINEDRLVPTVWSEHCVECSAPECYGKCPIYQKRIDGECVRIKDGISPLGIDQNNMRSGAELRFSRWAKIECLYDSRSLAKEDVQRLYKILDNNASRMVGIARFLPGEEKKWIVTKGVYSLRQKFIRRKLQRKGSQSESLALILKAKSQSNNKLIIEIKNMDTLLFRNSIEIGMAYRTTEVELPILEGEDYKFLCLYPENVDSESEIFVEYLELAEKHVPMRKEQNGADKSGIQKKVKCVIWDLDNTLWDGVLIESGEVQGKDSIVNTIKELDSKGIVNSISSKNDYESAYAKLQELGISEYFVFSKINWDPKSINIQNTIKQMNVSADTVVFVDDTAFEREEVKKAIPQITVVDAMDIEEFVRSDRFNVPITDDSKKRRHTYHMLEKQQKEMKLWNGDIDDFLRSCNMRLLIGRPYESELSRCFELLQRTNQLNASGRRLSMEEVKQYWESEQFDTKVLICKDKFGDYGLVGFAIVKKGDVPVITDFVISCRVANKKIEHAFIQHLAQNSKSGMIQIRYKQTDRNGPIFKVVKELDMSMKEIDNESELYEYAMGKLMVDGDIVCVMER